MKIWQCYGAEHSMNLVLIGHFKSEEMATQSIKEIEEIQEFLQSTDHEFNSSKYDNEVFSFLSDKKIHYLSNYHIDHFLNEFHIEQDKNTIYISSDDALDGLINYLLDRGAKIEYFSKHDYPDS